MRTVSFSDAEVGRLLNSNFECCFTNTDGDPTAGGSIAHSPNEPAGPCTRGNGRQNVQTILLTPAGEIFHVATGYLGPDDLLEELRFGEKLFTELRQQPERDRELVVAAHQSRLRDQGFSSEQINGASNPLNQVLLGMPVPAGMQFDQPSAGRNVFAKITRQHILEDNRFPIHHPLMSKSEFEQRPQELVGNGRTFFSSSSASGMPQVMNQVRRGR